MIYVLLLVVKGDPQPCSEVTAALALQTGGLGCSIWCCRRSVPPEQATPSDDPCVWGAEQLDAQCLLFAGFSWMLQMWAREGLQICVCGTLHSLLSFSLLLHALVHAMGVTCGLCMTKNAGMWARGCCMGGTCPSTCVVGCAQYYSQGGCVLALRWVQMTQEGCGILSPSTSEESKWSYLSGPQGTAFGS